MVLVELEKFDITLHRIMGYGQLPYTIILWSKHQCTLTALQDFFVHISTLLFVCNLWLVYVYLIIWIFVNCPFDGFSCWVYSLQFSVAAAYLKWEKLGFLYCFTNNEDSSSVCIWNACYDKISSLTKLVFGGSLSYHFPIHLVIESSFHVSRYYRKLVLFTS